MLKSLALTLLLSLNVAHGASIPGLVMGKPTYSGSGCPAGSASAAISPDGLAVSVLFDQFQLNLGAGSPRRGLVTCELTIPFKAPGNYKAALVRAEYRGFMYAPKGATLNFSSTVGFYGMNTLPLPPTFPVSTTQSFAGPVNDEVFLTGLSRGGFSSCGGGTIFLKTAVGISGTTNPANEQVIAQLESGDVSAQPIVYHLDSAKMPLS